MPKITIIILNWNGIKDTIECLESVRKINYPNFIVIVVDNGSTDGSPEEIERLFSEIILIRNKDNLGYAEGNNIGIRHALKNCSDYIFVLNNDTVVDPQILKYFTEAADLCPEAGIFGGNVCSYSNSSQTLCVGGTWNSKTGEPDFVKEDEIINNINFNGNKELDFIYGCALFFRTKVIERIGFFEPKFFLTYEEIDWCSRARKSGFRCQVVPGAKLLHKVSVSFNGAGSPLQQYFNSRNRLLWANRNLAFYARWKFYISTLKIFFPHTFQSSNYSSIKRIYWDILGIRNNIPVFLSRIIGIKDFIFRRFGNCPVIIHNLNKVIKTKKLII